MQSSVTYDGGRHSRGSAVRPADDAFQPPPGPVGEPRSWAAGRTLHDEGDSVRNLWVLQSGWAARACMLKDGRRQIARLMLPGDVGPATSSLAPTGTIVAITNVTTAPLILDRDLVGSDAGVVSPARIRLQRLAHEEQAQILDHLVRLGQMSAYERMAHLLLELHRRLARVGLVSGDTMPLPLTQEMLADLLGLSIVHVNRTLRQLQGAGLIVYGKGKLAIPDLRALAIACSCGDLHSRTESSAETPM